MEKELNFQHAKRTKRLLEGTREGQLLRKELDKSIDEGLEALQENEEKNAKKRATEEKRKEKIQAPRELVSLSRARVWAERDKFPCESDSFLFYQNIRV